MASQGDIILKADTTGAEAALARLEAEIAEPKQNLAARGPRNLPKPSERKRRRTEQRASRRANRG